MPAKPRSARPVPAWVRFCCYLVMGPLEALLLSLVSHDAWITELGRTIGPILAVVAILELSRWHRRRSSRSDAG
jgi:hypothetical protein